MPSWKIHAVSPLATKETFCGRRAIEVMNACGILEFNRTKSYNRCKICDKSASLHKKKKKKFKDMTQQEIKKKIMDEDRKRRSNTTSAGVTIETILKTQDASKIVTHIVNDPALSTDTVCGLPKQCYPWKPISEYQDNGVLQPSLRWCKTCEKIAKKKDGPEKQLPSGLPSHKNKCWEIYFNHSLADNVSYLHSGACQKCSDKWNREQDKIEGKGKKEKTGKGYEFTTIDVGSGKGCKTCPYCGMSKGINEDHCDNETCLLEHRLSLAEDEIHRLESGDTRTPHSNAALDNLAAALHSTIHEKHLPKLKTLNDNILNCLNDIDLLKLRNMETLRVYCEETIRDLFNLEKLLEKV